MGVLATTSVRAQRSIAERPFGRSVVLIVQQGDGVGFEVRLRAELNALGFAVVVQRFSDGVPDGDQLENAARAVGAVAAVSGALSDGHVEIWVADRYTGKRLARRIAVPVITDGDDGTVAISVVELLRASLLEVHTSHRMTGEVSVDGAAASLAAPRGEEWPSVVNIPDIALPQKRLSVFVGATVLGTNMGGVPVLDLSLGGDVEFSNRLFVSVSGMVPLSRDFETGAGGTVSVRIGGMTSEVGYRFTRRAVSARYALSGGLMGMFYRVEGVPALGFVGADTTDAFAVPFVRNSLLFLFSRRVAVVMDVMVGVQPSAFVLYADGDKLTSYGPLVLGGGMCLALSL